MRPRGATLIELMCGLVVGAIVAAIALTSLAAVAVSVRTQRAEVAGGDAARMALAAMARDLAADATWRTCLDKRVCAGWVERRMRGTPMVATTQVAWAVDDGLRRCARTHERAACDEYVPGVVALDAEVDLRQADGRVARVLLTQVAETEWDAIVAIHLMLWMADGHRHERSVQRVVLPP